MTARASRLVTSQLVASIITTDALDLAARAATLMQIAGISVGEALAVAAEWGIEHGRRLAEDEAGAVTIEGALDYKAIEGDLPYV